MPERSNISDILLAIGAITLVIAMVLRPSIAYNAAIEGLETWWDIVFPALLPFFIGAQILLGLGIVHAMGVLLEPLMRPLFNIPGSGSFVLAMGLASGYPIGAVLTGNMRRDSLLNQYEAERLISTANTADPLFMSGAVAVGMFYNPTVALIIMISHYIAALLNGLVMRFHAPNTPITETDPDIMEKNVLKKAVLALLRARKKDGRPFGTLLGDAVRQSIDTLFVIGGLIILVSVILNVMEATPIVDVMHYFFSTLLSIMNLDPELASALTRGTFEITLGCQAAGTASAPLADRLIIAGAVIAWSGFSVHAQVAALVHDTDIRILPYIISRAIHASIAAIITYLLLPFSSYIGISTSTWISPVLAVHPEASITLNWFGVLGLSSIRFGIVSLLLIAGGLITSSLFINGRRW